MSHQDQVDSRMEEEEDEEQEAQAVGDRVLDQEDEGLIVETLLRNPVLCGNWKSFYRRLGLKESELKNLDTMVTILAKSMKELFTHMMQEWIAQNARPQLRDLLGILNSENNKKAVDDLETAFRNDRR